MPTVKDLRKAHGWSQQYLAEQARLSLRTITRIEAGAIVPTFNTVRRLADVFNVPVEEIKIENNTPVNG